MQALIAAISEKNSETVEPLPPLGARPIQIIPYKPSHTNHPIQSETVEPLPPLDTNILTHTNHPIQITPYKAKPWSPSCAPHTNNLTHAPHITHPLSFNPPTSYKSPLSYKPLRVRVGVRVGVRIGGLGRNQHHQRRGNGR